MMLDSKPPSMPLKDAVSFRALMMFSSACVGFCGAGPPPDFDLSFLSCVNFYFVPLDIFLHLFFTSASVLRHTPRALTLLVTSAHISCFFYVGNFHRMLAFHQVKLSCHKFTYQITFSECEISFPFPRDL